MLHRYSIKSIVCMECGTQQPVSNLCINSNCRTVFARYASFSLMLSLITYFLADIFARFAIFITTAKSQFTIVLIVMCVGGALALG